MSTPLTKDNVIQNKKAAIKKLNALLERYINEPSGQYLKKANLISYWLKDYVQYINFEDKFDPKRNISYKRGNVVKVSFGFNIGNEYGGLHYGIVLDNRNDHNSSVVTVIPLTSVKENKPVHNNSVELGNEIYRLLKLKYDTISKTLKDEKDEIDEMVQLFQALVHMAKTSIEKMKQCDDENVQQEEYINAKKYLDATDKLEDILTERAEHNEKEQKNLEKIGNEIASMKEGSIALVNQITTISKMRIFDPKNIHGVLAGISLSEDSMEKINQKVKELYTF